MSYFVIGFGGTGAKCVESFIHLAAAGLMPDNGPLFCIFVDPDGANGNLQRAVRIVPSYHQCRQMKLGATRVFRNELRIAAPAVWSPFRDRPQRLDQFFNYDSMHHSPAAQRFDVLYTPEEKEISLERGFRGHPSIGAAALTAVVRLTGEEPWDTLIKLINLDKKGT